MNTIIKRIEIDLYSPTSYEIIKAQQGDNHSRILEFALLNNGSPYTISNNILIKMEGHRGDNSSFPPKDCTIVNNIITARLDNDILYEPGTVEAKIVMYDKSDDSILSTIPFKIHVQKNPYDKNKLESEKQSAIDWLILNLEKLKSSFEEHISDFLNPHKVSKSQVGLGNVPNVTTNDQTPTYTEAASTAKLVSGEKLSAAFGKISKAVSDLLLHLSDNIRHITSSERTNWNNAHNNSHTHGNKSILDKITQNLLDNWSAAYTHINDSIKHITSSERTLWNTVSNKVDKVEGKGLSTNDYTTAEKEIVASISTGYVTGVRGNSKDPFQTGNITISPEYIGLENVDNTADKDKSVATAKKLHDSFYSTGSALKTPNGGGWYRLGHIKASEFYGEFIVFHGWNTRTPVYSKFIVSGATNQTNSWNVTELHCSNTNKKVQKVRVCAYPGGTANYDICIDVYLNSYSSSATDNWYYTLNRFGSDMRNNSAWVNDNFDANATIPTGLTAYEFSLNKIDWENVITKDNLLNKTYPIGSIYMSVNSTSPATLFGGTWVRWGNGRIPIGVDTSQTEFNTVEKTGGEKTHTLTAAEMPQHNHSISAQTVATTSNGAHTHSAKYSNTANSNGSAARVNGNGNLEGYPINSNGAHTHNVTIPAHNTDSKGSGTAHNNLPPYITCYMWKRTA